MKKMLSSLFLILMVGFVLVACSNDGDNSNANGNDSDTAVNNVENDANANDENATTGEKTEISFWHAMSGNNGDELQKIVDKFNEQSDTVSVEAIYQGSYDDSLTKLRAIGGSDEAPAIVQVFEIGTKYMTERDRKSVV